MDNAEEEVEKLLESVSLVTADDIYDEEVAWLKKYEKETVIPDKAIDEELEKLREVIMVRFWQETVIPDKAIDEELEKLRELIMVRFWQEAELEKQKALHNELAGREVYDLLSNVQKLALNYLAGHPSFEVDK